VIPTVPFVIRHPEMDKEAVEKLVREGLVTERNGEFVLTDKGAEEARREILTDPVEAKLFVGCVLAKQEDEPMEDWLSRIMLVKMRLARELSTPVNRIWSLKSDPEEFASVVLNGVMKDDQAAFEFAKWLMECFDDEVEQVMGRGDKHGES